MGCLKTNKTTSKHYVHTNNKASLTIKWELYPLCNEEFLPPGGSISPSYVLQLSFSEKLQNCS
jgi:hypothetical protein